MKLTFPTFTAMRDAAVAAFSDPVKSPNFTRLPQAPRPPSDGVIQRPEQANAAGLVSDFAIDRFATALTRMPDPDDVLKRAGLQRHDLKRLEFDDEISGALETRRDACVSSQWRLETGSEDEPGEQVTFVREQLESVWVPMMSGLWSAVPYGYAVSEAVYEQRTDGRVGIRRMSLKPMQWFEPLRDGRLLLVRPSEGGRTQLDQSLKFCMLRRNPTFQNPFGEALLSRLYWPWYFRHQGWRAWMQFVDRFGDPFVVTKSNNPKDLVSSLIGMGVKNVIGVGTDDAIDVLMQSGDSTFDRLDQRLTQRIVKTILGQTLTSDVAPSGAGSYALGKVHNEVRQDKRRADCNILAEAGQWLTNALWAINRFDGTPPKFVFADPDTIDVERADRDVALKNAGIVRFTKDYVIRAHGFRSDDIDVPEPGEDGPQQLGPDGKPLPPQRVKKAPPKKLSEGPGRDRFTPAQQRVEALAESAMDNAPESPISDEDLRVAIMGAKDAEDLEERIAVLMERQDPAFADVVAKALFAANILGYVHATDGD